MATSGTKYRSILVDLKRGNYKPIYYLMGDEPFFIDSISDYIRDNAIESEEERNFNQIVVYGSDISMNEVVQRAKAYPMGAERQVIIVKEAQNLIKESTSNISATDLLADDAIFRLASLYETKLNDKAKALELYQSILKNYSDSLFVVEARKRFRALREGVTAPVDDTRNP